MVKYIKKSMTTIVNKIQREYMTATVVMCGWNFKH
jgi:hypothetical protein